MTTGGTALITGAGRGFGRGLAAALAAQGWSVFGLVRSIPPDPLPISYLHADVTSPEAADAVAAALAGRRLDLLVNNAGIDVGSHRPDDLDPAVVMASMAVHAAGAARMMRAALPALRRAPRATIINVSSRLGSMQHAAERRYVHLEQSIAYRMAKSAVNMLTLASAEALADTSIAVCAIHPGRLRTDMAAPDADLDVDEAVARLLRWLRSGSRVDGRFYSLDDETELPW